MSKETDTPKASENSNILSINNSILKSRIDAEKLLYAIQGTEQTTNRIIKKCSTTTCNCTEQQCNSTQENVLSEILDSKHKFNLNDAEHIEAVMLILDRLTGLPAQPINEIYEDGSSSALDVSKVFGVDIQSLVMHAMIKAQSKDDKQKTHDVDGQGLMLQDFDALLLTAINDMKLSYKEVIALCLDYIHALVEFIKQQKDQKKAI